MENTAEEKKALHNTFESMLSEISEINKKLIDKPFSFDPVMSLLRLSQLKESLPENMGYTQRDDIFTAINCLTKRIKKLSDIY